MWPPVSQQIVSIRSITCLRRYKSKRSRGIKFSNFTRNCEHIKKDKLLINKNLI